MTTPKCVPIWYQKDILTSAPKLLEDAGGNTKGPRCGICLFSSQPLPNFRSGLKPGFLAIRGRVWQDENKLRQGKMGFPKGGLDFQEDPWLGALREFKEETGIDLLKYRQDWRFQKKEKKGGGGVGGDTLFFLELLDTKLFSKVVPLDKSEIDAIFWIEKDYPIVPNKWNYFSRKFLCDEKK